MILTGIPPSIHISLCPVPADRAAQSAAVRACACDLLRAQGVNAPQIGRYPSGAPLWPAGWVGSLAHSAGWGAVAVAPADSLRAVGIDLEDPQRMKRALWAHVLTPTEINTLAHLPEHVANERVAASFSAKEAIYKALSPLGGRVPGFHDVELVWDASGGFTARSRTAETPAHLHDLAGFFTLHHPYTLALAWLTTGESA